jgi:hypothetical protein
MQRETCCHYGGICAKACYGLLQGITNVSLVLGFILDPDSHFYGFYQDTVDFLLV